MPEPNPWAALAVLAVLLWYVVEWERLRLAGCRLSPLRHPALLFVQALRQLFGAKQLALPLLALWLVSGVLWYAWQRPYQLAQASAASGEVARQQMDRNRYPVTPDQLPMGELLRRGWEQLRTMSGAYPTQALTSSIPEPFSLSRPLLPFAGSAILWTAVALALAWLAWNRPPWLGASARVQPAVALAFVLLPVAAALVSNASQAPALHGPAATLLIVPVLYLSMIPVYAPLCHLLLQIAQGRRRLSLTLAIRSTMCGLFPLVWFVAARLLAPTLIRALTDGVPLAPLLVQLPEYLLVALSLALLFVPWIILRGRVSFRHAFWRNLRLWQANWRDLVPFALRYVLVIFPLEYVHAMFSGFHAAALPSAIGSLAGALINMISLLMAAQLYLHLERATPAGDAPVPVEELPVPSYASS